MSKSFKDLDLLGEVYFLKGKNVHYGRVLTENDAKEAYLFAAACFDKSGNKLAQADAYMGVGSIGFRSTTEYESMISNVIGVRV